MYDNHLKEGVYGYNSWRGLKASDVAKNIERQYTTDLDRYRFDKTLCMSCPHNTNNMTLFCEGRVRQLHQPFVLGRNERLVPRRKSRTTHGAVPCNAVP